MATIRKRNNRYTAVVRRVGHKDLYKTFDTKKDALAWATLREAEIVRGELQDFTEASRTSFIKALDNYESDALTQSKYPRKLKSQIRVLRESCLSALNLKSITPREVAEFRNQRLKSVSDSTVIKDLNKLSAFFNWLIKERFVQLPQGNPVKNITKPKLGVQHERARRVDAHEEKILVTYLKQHSPITSFLVRAALATGMRRSELLAVRTSDFDLNNKTLKIPNTKNGYPRVIPLSSLAFIAFNDARVHRGEMSPGMFYEAPLFEIKADSVTQAFNRACKALGIANLRFHDLRHEAISRLFEQGLDMIEVALISGHRDMRMLQRYTHLRPEDVGKKLRDAWM